MPRPLRPPRHELPTNVERPGDSSTMSPPDSLTGAIGLETMTLIMIDDALVV